MDTKIEVTIYFILTSAPSEADLLFCHLGASFQRENIDFFCNCFLFVSKFLCFFHRFPGVAQLTYVNDGTVCSGGDAKISFQNCGTLDRLDRLDRALNFQPPSFLSQTFPGSHVHTILTRSEMINMIWRDKKILDSIEHQSQQQSGDLWLWPPFALRGGLRVRLRSTAVRIQYRSFFINESITTYASTWLFYD